MSVSPAPAHESPVYDPFLLHHEIFPHFYLLSYPMSPISIRDQMVRGWMMIDRACDNKLVEEDGRPILIVGAGVAGATAAMVAAQRHIYTVLVDSASEPFTVQASATTRWLDPLQYDWPLDHWKHESYPSREPYMPLPYEANWADELAKLWTEELKDAVTRFAPYLELELNTSARAINPLEATDLRVELNGPNGVSHRDFGLVIWAAGHGRERCELRRKDANGKRVTIFKALPFWEADQLTEPSYGVQRRLRTLFRAKPRVVIAGAGDGGLQDFIRAVTKCSSAKEAYQDCNIPPHLESKLQSIEERAHRWMMWQDQEQHKGKKHEHLVHSALQKAHEAIVDEALEISEVIQGLKRLLHNAPDNVRLVYPCNHFTNEYGLNRFLVLLLAKYLEQTRKQKALYPFRSVTDIASDDGHQCTIVDRSRCYGHPHRVILVPHPECWSAPAGGPEEKLDANVIVLRLGIDPTKVPKPPIKEDVFEILLSKPPLFLPYHVSPDEG